MHDVERFACSRQMETRCCRLYFFHGKSEESTPAYRTDTDTRRIRCRDSNLPLGEGRKGPNHPFMKNVFCNKNFRLAFFGALVSNVGALLYNFAVSFYILNITDANAVIQGVYLAVCSLCTLGASLIGGVISDRMNKAKIMYLCDLIKGAMIGLATFVMLKGKDNVTVELTVLFVIGAAGNIIGGIFSPAANAIIPEIVDKEQIQQANSYYSAMYSVQAIAGVVLAGILYNTISVYTLFFIVGSCYIASGVSEMFIRIAHTAERKRLTLRSSFEDIRDGFNYLTANKALLILIVSVLFVNFFLTPITGNFFPYFIETDLTEAEGYLLSSYLTPQQWFSLLSVLMGVASLVASIIISSLPPIKKCSRPAKICLSLMSVIMFLLAAFYYVFIDRMSSMDLFLISLCAGAVALGALTCCINIPIDTAVLTQVDSSHLGKVSAMISIGSQALTPLASLLAGFAINGLGATPLLFICAVGFLAADLLLVFSKKVKEI